MIPRTAHFTWIGREFPWANVLAISSAVKRGGFDNVVLHHTDDLIDSEAKDELTRIPRFVARRLEAEDYLAELDDGAKFVDLYRRLVKPAVRSDLLRAAILAREGGVYLDLDTVTVRSLAPLCDEADFFYGCEYSVWPLLVKNSRNPLLHARSLGLDVLRFCCTKTLGGWRVFRHFEHLCYATANNGVMAAQRQHPLLLEMLERMKKIPREQENVWTALGPHLLQLTVDGHTHDNVKVHPPRVFYPLAPEISRHWFRNSKNPRADVVLFDETRLVHWYLSKSMQWTDDFLSPAYIRENSSRQLLSAVALPIIDAEFDSEVTC